MARHHWLIATILLSALNGIFSPYLTLVVALAPMWLPHWLPDEPGALFFLASLITSTTTLLLSAVPAALLERMVPGLRGSRAIAICWTAFAVLLCLPGMIRLFAIAVVAGS